MAQQLAAQGRPQLISPLANPANARILVRTFDDKVARAEMRCAQETLSVLH